MEKIVKDYLKEQMNGRSTVYIQDMATDLKIDLKQLEYILAGMQNIEVVDDIIQVVPY